MGSLRRGKRKKTTIRDGQRGKKKTRESQNLPREKTTGGESSKEEMVNSTHCCQEVPTMGTGKWMVGVVQER